jgi:hypothetical protein
MLAGEDANDYVEVVDEHAVGAAGEQGPQASKRDTLRRRHKEVSSDMLADLLSRPAPEGLPQDLLCGEELQARVRLYTSKLGRLDWAAKIASCCGMVIGAALNWNVAATQFEDNSWDADASAHGDGQVERYCQRIVILFDFIVTQCVGYWAFLALIIWWRSGSPVHFQTLIQALHTLGSFSVMSAFIPFLSPGKYFAVLAAVVKSFAGSLLLLLSSRRRKIKLLFQVATDEIEQQLEQKKGTRVCDCITMLHTKCCTCCSWVLPLLVFVASALALFVWALAPIWGAAACFFKIRLICPLVGEHWALSDWLLAFGIVNQLKGIDRSASVGYNTAIACLVDEHKLDLAAEATVQTAAEAKAREAMGTTGAAERAHEGVRRAVKGLTNVDARKAFVNVHLTSAFVETHGRWGWCLRATLEEKDIHAIMRKHGDVINAAGTAAQPDE